MKKPIVHKKYLMLYSETARQRVINVLMKYPELEFSLSDLAKEAGVAKANIGDILEDFCNRGLITIEKLSRIWRIKANQKDGNFVKIKIVHNMNNIYQSGLVEFLNEGYKNPKAIVLFGSYRNGEDISNSDIDIAIERDSGEYMTIRLEELSELEKLLGRKIQIHLFSRKKIDSSIFNNMANGIVLSGFLEVRP